MSNFREFLVFFPGIYIQVMIRGKNTCIQVERPSDVNMKAMQTLRHDNPAAVKAFNQCFRRSVLVTAVEKSSDANAQRFATAIFVYIEQGRLESFSHNT